MGGLFLVKSFCNLLSTFDFFDDIYPVSIGINIWDFVMFLITEIAPTLIFIYVGKKKTSKETVNPMEQELNNLQNNKFTPNDDKL